MCVFFIFCLVSFVDKLAAQRDICIIDSYVFDTDGKVSSNVLGAWKVA